MNPETSALRNRGSEMRVGSVGIRWGAAGLGGWRAGGWGSGTAAAPGFGASDAYSAEMKF